MFDIMDMINPNNDSYYKRNSARIHAAQAKRYREDPEYRARQLANSRAWYAANRDQRNLIRRKWELKQYGLTPKAYWDLYSAQNGVCAICFKPERVLAVDHNHITQAVRGLLCGSCNRALGLFKDSSGLLRNACAYLERTPQQ
jgi:hypothetical protein